ncbi:hypothetical protein AG1IA_06434 [Rhizoctonia solani AG-1 IA]|uniref:Uncharacterized protein n=1 Tax=Thanatephorus cucumeris (strain AG1-IA) TaxID=983506 RepID=L8WS12_THACA|nr:hypothetical protein AG1IA_06434 [Rhizoctonia solani AG-1 IA]
MQLVIKSSIELAYRHAGKEKRAGKAILLKTNRQNIRWPIIQLTRGYDTATITEDVAKDSHFGEKNDCSTLLNYHFGCERWTNLQDVNRTMTCLPLYFRLDSSQDSFCHTCLKAEPLVSIIGKYISGGGIHQRVSPSRSHVLRISKLTQLDLNSFVLYLLYFPAHLKFVTIKPQPHPGHAPECDCETCELALKGEYIESTSEWKMSVVLACIVAAHFLISLFTTFFVVLNDDRDLGDNTTPPSRRVTAWATFLGLSSTILYRWIPEYSNDVYSDSRSRADGSQHCTQARTIPSVFPLTAQVLIDIFVHREGTDWTSWATYAAAGIMQGMLLLMCLRWKRRQTKLGIDDYGRPIAANGQDERAPLLGPN